MSWLFYVAIYNFNCVTSIKYITQIRQPTLELSEFLWLWLWISFFMSSPV